MAFYDKYLKYKNKYISLKKHMLNQNGGMLLNTPVKIYNEFSNTNLETAFGNEIPLLFVKNTLNNPNQIFTLEKNNNNYKIKHNNRCVKTNGVHNADRYTLDTCNSNNQQLFNLNKIGTNYMIQNVNNPDMCMDSNYGQYAHNWNCDINNQNQQFKITHNFKNNDTNGSHIIPQLQNLILAYSNANTFEEYFMSMHDLSTTIGIAMTFANKYFYRIEGTFSIIFCPLIYNALNLGGVAIPHSWTIFHEPPPPPPDRAKFENAELFKVDSQEYFQDCSLRLSRVPGWIRYATYILTELVIDDINKYGNDFEDERMFRQMIRIKQILGL
jgi:hypothetical protein